MARNDQLRRIITGCKNGDPECFSRLIDIYSSRCYGYFYRLTGNKDISDELLSRLFAKLVEKVDSYKGPCFESWLFKVASNVFNDYLRAKKRQQQIIEAVQQEALTETVKPPRYDNEVFDKLQSQLAKLDADTKEVIMLRFYSQLSFKDIAELRGEPIGTTLSKAHRGLKKLKDLMSS